MSVSELETLRTQIAQLQTENDQLQAKLADVTEYVAGIPNDLESVLMDMVKESTASSIVNIAYFAMVLSDVFPNLAPVAVYAQRASQQAQKHSSKKKMIKRAYV